MAAARSNLSRTAAWPVLLANLVELRRSALQGFRRHNVASGDQVPVTLSGEQWELAGASGKRPLQADLSSLQLPPGSYRLLQRGGERDRLQVNLLDPEESDLRQRSSGELEGQTAGGKNTLATRDRSPWPLLGLLGLLLLDYAWAAPGLLRGRKGRA